jgi:hypothetical protein
MKAASDPATSGDLGCHKFNAMGPKRPQKQVKQIHTSGEIATEKLAPKSGVSIHIAKKRCETDIGGFSGWVPVGSAPNQHRWGLICSHIPPPTNTHSSHYRMYIYIYVCTVHIHCIH